MEEVIDEVVVDCTGCVSDVSCDHVLFHCDVDVQIDEDVFGPVTVVDSRDVQSLWIDDEKFLKSVLNEKPVVSRQDQFGVNRAYDSETFFERNGVDSDYRYCYVQMDYCPEEENPWWAVRDIDSFSLEHYSDFFWNKDILFNYRVFQGLSNQSFNFDVMRVFIMSPDTSYTIRCLVRDSVMLVSNNLIVLEGQNCYRSVFQNEGELVVVLSSEVILDDLRPTFTSHKLKGVLKMYCDQYNSKPALEQSCYCYIDAFKTWVSVSDNYAEIGSYLCFRRKKVRALFLKNIDRERKIVVLAFCFVSPYLKFHGFHPFVELERAVEESLKGRHVVLFDRNIDSVTVPLLQCNDYRCYCHLLNQGSLDYKGMEDEFVFFSKLRKYRPKNLVLIVFNHCMIRVGMVSHPVDKMFQFVRSSYESADSCCYNKLNHQNDDDDVSVENEVEGDTYCEMNDAEKVYNLHNREPDRRQHDEHFETMHKLLAEDLERFGAPLSDDYYRIKAEHEEDLERNARERSREVHGSTDKYYENILFGEHEKDRDKDKDK
jgi:hypothetical protein